MTIILNNVEVEQLLSPQACVEALEEAYLAMGRNEAGNRPRSDLYTATSHEGAFYRLRTMEGAIGSLGVAAIRIGSDVVRWYEENGETKQQHVAAAADNRWVGLILVFDVNTSEPLLIFPDGALQRMRVGATSAIAAKYMARKDSKTLAILGSGNQARAALLTMAAVFPLQQIRVFSPKPEKRRAFANEMAAMTSLPVEAADDAKKAVRGADLVACATNSLAPVMFADWLEPGMHVGSVEWCELDDASYQRFDRMAVHVRKGEVLNFLAGVPSDQITGLDKHDMDEWMTRLPGLDEIMDGNQPARGAGEVSCFINNVGSGLQFAAAGKKLYQLAKAQGVGRVLPTDWFTQELPS